MMTILRKTISAITVVSACAVGLAVGSPAAGARPSNVLATYALPAGFYSVDVGQHAVWALKADEFHFGRLYRIDPASGTVRLVRRLPFPAGAMTIAFGSVWVSDYFGNTVWRLSPAGRVQAEVGVGLQPQWLHAAFGSLWVSNHHSASVSRIDPRTDTVVATVPIGAPDTFRNGPQGMTDDGTRLYAASSNIQALQSVDPKTEAVSTGPSLDDAFCGPLTAIAGFVWSVDPCTGATYQLSTDGSVHHVIPSTGAPGGLAVLGGDLWLSDDRTFDQDTFQGSRAVLDQLDPATGRIERTVAIGGDATDVVSGFGDLWVFDAVASTIRRVQV
jgi:YVTN family beta-propeller protein